MGRTLKIITSNKDKWVRPWNADKVLSEAMAERELFLERHPRYRNYQHEIDEILDKAGSSENRMAVLGLMMEAKLIELHSQMTQLHQILTKMAA